jgi:3-hydroxy-9,10-secoandrosta-1,3,5(10)-triene-9,17-dione monooxygenase
MAESNQQAVIAGVTDLLPALRQRAQEAEDSRMLPAESVKALAETGFFRLLQPRRAAWKPIRSRSSPPSG